MLGRSKTKPSQAQANAMAQRYRGVKTSSKQPATSTVAAKPSPKPVQPPKSASPVLTREQKYQQAQKFGNAEYLNKPEVRRANNELYKNIENMVTSQIKKAPTTSGGSPEGRGQIGMGLGNVGKPLPGRQTASPAPAGPTLRSGQIPAGGFGALRAQLGDTSTAPMQASANASNLQQAMLMGAPSGSPQMPSMGQNLPQVGAQSPMGKPPMQAGGAGGLMNQAGPMGMKKGGAVKTFKKGGSVDGCAQRGKTKGRYI